MPADFDKQSYWHHRFTTETSFEWLISSIDFMALIEPYLANLEPSARILHVGIGTSSLQNCLRQRGFLDVTNIDYEPLAIQRGMELETKEFGDVKMKYEVQDATQLNFPHKFDLVVDKSACDAMACTGDDFLVRMANGVLKHLADGGVWISLSYSAFRFEVDGLPFDVEVIDKIPTPKSRQTDPDIYHWCYLLRPKLDANGDSSIRGE